MAKSFVAISILFLLAYVNSIEVGKLDEDHPHYLLKGGLQAEGDDDHYNSFGAVCRSKNYPFEQHKVLTSDGFLLTVFRIPGKKGETLQAAISAKRPVILIWHGLSDSADSFILNDEDKAPALVLANKGYDVWLGNTRGNKYSRQHRFLDPERDADQADFFGFSFDEAGLHDTNSTITYIKTQTGKTKISVITHSLGSTMFLIGMMDNPTFYKTNVAVFVMLGSTSIMNHTENTFLQKMAESDYYINLFKDYKWNELFTKNYYSSVFYTYLCQNFIDL